MVPHPPDASPDPAPYYSDDQITLWHGDSLEVLRTRHDWQLNKRSGQRVCPRCWTVID